MVTSSPGPGACPPPPPPPACCSSAQAAITRTAQARVASNVRCFLIPSSLLDNGSLRLVLPSPEITSLGRVRSVLRRPVSRYPVTPTGQASDEVRNEHRKDQQRSDHAGLCGDGKVGQAQTVPEIQDDKDGESHADQAARAAEDAHPSQE